MNPKSLKCFRTLFTQDYFGSLSCRNLWQTVETAKRILTKEKIDRQLAGQTPSTPFISIHDNAGCNKRTVYINKKNVLDSKIEKLTAMMGKSTTQSDNQGRLFKSKIHQGKRGCLGRTNYYDKDQKQGRYR